MIDCTPNAIALASKCYCGFSKTESDAAAIWGLCQWASKLETCQISWTPSTALAYWVDLGGIHNGFDLPTFLATADIPTVTLLNLDTAGISSLTCLEYLPKLSTLQISGNPLLTSVDLSEVPNLVAFEGNNGGWTSFDVSNNPLLQTLDVSVTPSLTSITGLLSCPNLIGLGCNQCDITGTLDLTGLSNLQILSCYSNANLTTLTLTGCTALTTLDCSSCNLSALDVSGLANLDSFTCINNPNMTSFNGSGATLLNFTSGILDLTTGMGSLVTVNLSNHVGANQVDCSNNQVTALDLTNSSGITDVKCHDNQLTSLDVSDLLTMDYIECYNNSITSLDFSTNLVMETLLCQNNAGLTALTIGNSPNYLTIDASGCALPDTPAGVNDCLVTLVAIGPIAGVGSVILNLGTNSAPTVGPPDGIAAKAALPGLGWITVLTN